MFSYRLFKKEIPHIDVDVLDGNVIGHNIHKLRRAFDGQRYDLSGVYFDTLSYHRANELVSLVKNYSKLVIAGGPLLLLCPKVS